MFCILASNSPRRQELLRQIGIDFTVFAPDVDELCMGISTTEVPVFLAKKKLDAALAFLAGATETEKATDVLQKSFKIADFVLAADTIVTLNSTVYGKPCNAVQAAAFLREFSGKTHQVITAIAVYNTQTRETVCKSVKTAVTFSVLSDTEIASYLASGEWKDAAGAYKIQGRGSCLVSRIEGSYSCVVGLPVFELYEILKKY